MLVAICYRTRCPLCADALDAADLSSQGSQALATSGLPSLIPGFREDLQDMT